jgi:hypothetical protein
MRLVAGLLALFLGACTTIETTMPTPEQLTGFDSSKQAMIVVNASTNVGCGDFFLGINRNNASTNTVVRTLNDFGYDTSQPAIMIVEPGKFTLDRASCTIPGYYPSDLPNTFAWFGDVDIAAGEIVYIGTFHTDVLEVETKRGAASQVFSALLALDFSKSDSTQYPTYEFVNQLEEVIERLNVSHPAIAQQLVFRPIPALIAKDDFSAALQRAHAADEDGNPPAPDVAKAKWIAELQAMFGTLDVEGGNAPPASSPSNADEQSKPAAGS